MTLTEETKTIPERLEDIVKLLLWGAMNKEVQGSLKTLLTVCYFLRTGILAGKIHPPDKPIEVVLDGKVHTIEPGKDSSLKFLDAMIKYLRSLLQAHELGADVLLPLEEARAALIHFVYYRPVQVKRFVIKSSREPLED